jgi:hypothetical protein
MRRLTPLLLACAPLVGVVACSDETPSTLSRASDSARATADAPTPVTDPDTTDATQDITDVSGVSDAFDLEPGRYFFDPDHDPSTPLRVAFDITAPGWTSWDGAAKVEDYGHALFTVVLASNVVRDGCTDHRPRDPAVGPTVADLVAALTDLAPFEVTAPPSDVSISGYSGQHLQLTVPADFPSSGVDTERVFTECDEQALHSWTFPAGDAFYGYNGEPGRTEEFWILDVDGTRLVVSTNTSPDTPTETLTELQAIFDSMQIVT